MTNPLDLTNDYTNYFDLLEKLCDDGYDYEDDSDYRFHPSDPFWFTYFGLWHPRGPKERNRYYRRKHEIKHYHKLLRKIRQLYGNYYNWNDPEDRQWYINHARKGHRVWRWNVEKDWNDQIFDYRFSRRKTRDTVRKVISRLRVLERTDSDEARDASEYLLAQSPPEMGRRGS
jgi:hypothetical protein